MSYIDGKMENCYLYNFNSRYRMFVLQAQVGDLYHPADSYISLYRQKGDEVDIYGDKCVSLEKEKLLLCIKECHEAQYESKTVYSPGEKTIIKENRVFFLCEGKIYYYVSKIHNY